MMESFHANPIEPSHQSDLEANLKYDTITGTIVASNSFAVTNQFAAGDSVILGTLTVAGPLVAANGIVNQGVTTNAPTIQKLEAITSQTLGTGEAVLFTVADLAAANLRSGIYLVVAKLENDADGFYYLGTVQVTGGAFQDNVDIVVKGFTNVDCQDATRTFTFTGAYAGADTNLVVSLYKFNM